MPRVSNKSQSPNSLNWRELSSNRDALLKAVKSGDMFIKFLNALEKVDISSIIEVDAITLEKSISAKDFILLFTKKEYSLETGFPSAGFICMFDIIAKENRSDYSSDNATEFPQYSTGVPVIPARFRDKYDLPYSAWDCRDNDVTAIIFGKSIAGSMDKALTLYGDEKEDVCLFESACININYLIETVGIPAHLVHKLLSNPDTKRKQSPKAIGTETLKKLELNEEQRKVFDPIPYNSLDYFAKAMILNDWIFASTHKNLLRSLVNLNRSKPFFNYTKTGDDPVEVVATNLGVLALLDKVPEQHVEVVEVPRKKKVSASPW